MKTKKEKIGQQIVATLVVFFMVVMVVGTISIPNVSAIGGNTVLQQVITAGSLSLETPAAVNFNAFTLNTFSVNSLANLTQVNMRDARGSGAGWTVYGSANNMTAGNGATISNAYLSWSPGTIYALDGSSNTGVVAGPSYSGNFADGLKVLANTSTNNGMGNYVINATALNLLILSTTAAGTYQNTLTVTIS